MARQFTEKKLVIASHNLGKVSEIADLLAPYGVEVISAGDLDLPEPEETGMTFKENALIKSRSAAETSGLPALADDSGLSVSALNGEPGIYSARWAGPEKDFQKTMQDITDKIDGQTDKRAKFVCALSLTWPDTGQGLHDEVFEGTVEGQLVWPTRGDRGFGYDPFFVADGHNVTFAEMEPAEKHAISHRADAFRQLVSHCFGGD